MGGIIFLVGFMCCGKTTLGRALAEAARVRFVDLDDYVEESAGMSIPQIFATYGEEGFRKRESDALRALARSAADEGGVTVVGCGGGTPCHNGNMELMNRLGTTVMLSPCRERLLNRLMEGKTKRPLLAALPDSEIESKAFGMLEARMPFYSMCAETFDSSLLETPSEIAATTALFIQRFGLEPRTNPSK